MANVLRRSGECGKNVSTTDLAFGLSVQASQRPGIGLNDHLAGQVSAREMLAEVTHSPSLATMLEEMAADRRQHEQLMTDTGVEICSIASICLDDCQGGCEGAPA